MPDIQRRNNVSLSGRGGQPMLFAHGFGCDQNMWRYVTPAIMKNEDRAELGQELVESFCSTDPVIARQFAEVTFLSDNRSDLAAVTVPSLVLQCAEDTIAPRAVGEYVARTMPRSTFRYLDATGHCPHMSAPDETIAAIRDYLRDDG